MKRKFFSHLFIVLAVFILLGEICFAGSRIIKEAVEKKLENFVKMSSRRYYKEILHGSHKGLIFVPGRTYVCSCDVAVNTSFYQRTPVVFFETQREEQEKAIKAGKEWQWSAVDFYRWRYFKLKYGKLTQENAFYLGGLRLLTDEEFKVLSSGYNLSYSYLSGNKPKVEFSQGVTPNTSQLKKIDSVNEIGKTKESGSDKEKLAVKTTEGKIEDQVRQKKAEEQVAQLKLKEAEIKAKEKELEKQKQQEAARLAREQEEKRQQEQLALKMAEIEKREKEVQLKLKEVEKKAKEKELEHQKQQEAARIVREQEEKRQQEQLAVKSEEGVQKQQKNAGQLGAGATIKKVKVKGQGIDRNAAIRDAMRSAVEKAIGVFVDSRTLVQNAKVELDEIVAQSKGFVNNINIISEQKLGNEYRVLAECEVDTDLNSALMNQLTMVMSLNDPRIAVIVLEKGKGQVNNNAIAETTLNERLLNLGFSHVVDANFLSKSQNLELLNSLYTGDKGLVRNTSNSGVDYLVFGSVQTEDDVQKAKNKVARISVKVIKYDTGEIITVFGVLGSGCSVNDAIVDASEKAAFKLDDKFRKLNNNLLSGMKLTVVLRKGELFNRLLEELRSLRGVQNVIVREQKGKIIWLDIQSFQKAGTILAMLKEVSKLTITANEVTDGTAKITVE